MGKRTSYKSASLWSISGTAVSQGIRFINNLILWRLLFPEAFGVMAIINSVLMGLTMLSDIGTTASIVQNPRGTEKRFLDTAWTFQVIRGLLLGLILFFLAEPIANFYDAPYAAKYIRVTALIAVFQGLISVKFRLIARNVDVKSQTIINTISQVSASAVSITWAVISPDIWALVAGGVTSVAIKLLLSHVMIKGYQNSWIDWEVAAARDIFSFGKWVFASTLLTFGAMHADRLLFGKLVSLGELGAYSIGQGLASIPMLILMRLNTTVLFPAFSRANGNDRGAFSETVSRTRLPILLFSGWLCSALFAAGPGMVFLLYGENAEIATWTVAALAPGIWALSIRLTYDSALLALGESKWLAVANLTKIAAMAILIPYGFHTYGFPGAVAAYAGAEYVAYFSIAYAAKRNGILFVAQDFTLSLLIALAFLLGWVMRINNSAESNLILMLHISAYTLIITAFWAAAYFASRKLPQLRQSQESA